MASPIRAARFRASSSLVKRVWENPYSFLVFASSLFGSSKSLGCPFFLEEGLFLKFWANIRQKFVSGLDVTFARLFVCYCVRLSLECLTCKYIYIMLMVISMGLYDVG